MSRSLRWPGGIFGSRKPTDPQSLVLPGSEWLGLRTLRARWLLLAPVRAERLTLMSLLRVQGATESPVVSGDMGLHTQAYETIAGLSSPGPQGAAVWSLTAVQL